MIDLILLCGYMGSGKSTVSRELASRLSWEIIDLDEQVEKESQLSISQIFDEYGETYFRLMEQTEMKKIFAERSKTIIALGGGTICNDNALELVKNQANAILVYLKYTPKELVARLEIDKAHRPLIAKEKDLLSFVTNHLKERTPFYNQSDLILEDEPNITTMIHQIIQYQKFRS